MTSERLIAELKRIAANPDSVNLHLFVSRVAAAEARELEMLAEILRLLRK